VAVTGGRQLCLRFALLVPAAQLILVKLTVIFLFLHLPGLQDPNSVFQVSLVPAPKLPVGISLGLQFVVVDAFAPVSSLNFRLESLQHSSIL